MNKRPELIPHEEVERRLAEAIPMRPRLIPRDEINDSIDKLLFPWWYRLYMKIKRKFSK